MTADWYTEESNESVKEQKRYMHESHVRIMRKIHTVVEMQCSPNPLTAEEITKLKAKRPELWSFLP